MTDILAIGSHPDDIEFGCGGILAKMAAQKKSIVMVDLTRGEKGSNGTPELRQQEGEASAKLIDAQRVFLDFPDCAIMDTYDGRLQLVKVIRQFKPKLVIAPYWKGEQNHPDHLATGLMARYACRYARFAKILPDLPIHRVEGILHYPPPTLDNPDFIIDISDYVPVWERMMDCHSSQMKTFNYKEWCLRLASKNGVMIGTAYAQCLVRGNPIVVDDLMAIAKSTREI